MSVCTEPAAPPRRGAARDRVGARLLALARGEERDQVEQRERLADHGREARLGHAELLAHRVRLVVVQLRQLRVEPGAHRRRPGAARLGVLHELGRRLERLALGHVRHVEHRLRGERLEAHVRPGSVRRAAARCAPPAPRAAPRPRRVSQRSSATATLSSDFACLDTRSSRRSACSRSANSSSVSTASTSASGSTRPSGCTTCASSWARTTWTIASVSRMFAEELVAEPLAAVRAAHEAGDVVELDRLVHHRRGAHGRGHLIEPLVRHRHDRHVRLDRRERVVRRLRAGPRERVEERGLAGVRQPDDPDLHGAGAASAPGRRRAGRRPPRPRGSARRDRDARSATAQASAYSGGAGRAAESIRAAGERGGRVRRRVRAAGDRRRERGKTLQLRPRAPHQVLDGVLATIAASTVAIARL